MKAAPFFEFLDMRSWLTKLTIIFLVGIIFSCDPDPTTDTTINGDVLDYETHQVIGNARIEIYESQSGANFAEDYDRLLTSGRADVNGHYSLTFPLTKGRAYGIRAIKENYEEETQPKRITSGAFNDCDLYLAALSWFKFIVIRNQELQFDSIIFNNSFKITADTVFHSAYPRYDSNPGLFFWQIYDNGQSKVYSVYGRSCQPHDTCAIVLKNQ